MSSRLYNYVIIYNTGFSPHWWVVVKGQPVANLTLPPVVTIVVDLLAVALHIHGKADN